MLFALATFEERFEDRTELQSGKKLRQGMKDNL
jgi:hypothetical protein